MRWTSCGARGSIWHDRPPLYVWCNIWCNVSMYGAMYGAMYGMAYGIQLLKVRLMKQKLWYKRSNETLDLP
jgi:hypothetical protein